ncbi:hypothetical protein V5O48_008374 [Marasmius crinis-equi]|uniref:Alpha/beta hydrolase fold-3 domain-containing protein n=1 Tax=Marasmius crinis-equi TaxID=585013 RepID=A0ABR3FEE2_9AGAR
MAQYAHLSEMDPEFAAIAAAGLPPSDVESLASTIRNRDQFHEIAKRMVQEARKEFLPASTDYTVTDHQIPVGEGVSVLARCVVPVQRDGEDAKFPLVFHLHGGGYCLGNADTADYFLRTVSVKMRVVTVNCEYRLAPEHKFPAAYDDALAALKYVASHPSQFCASLEKGFIIYGASSGGNLATVLAHQARDDPVLRDTRLTGQLLQMPSTIHPDAYPDRFRDELRSLEQNKEGPIFTKEGYKLVLGLTLHFFILNYYDAPPTDLRISPLLYESHENLPPTFFQVAGLDPLRDEGLLYEKVLREAGVKTKLEIDPFHVMMSSHRWVITYVVGNCARKDWAEAYTKHSFADIGAQDPIPMYSHLVKELKKSLEYIYVVNPQVDGITDTEKVGNRSNEFISKTWTESTENEVNGRRLISAGNLDSETGTKLTNTKGDVVIPKAIHLQRAWASFLVEE